MSADAGYFSGENADEDGAGLDLLIAAGRDDPAAAATKTTGIRSTASATTPRATSGSARPTSSCAWRRARGSRAVPASTSTSRQWRTARPARSGPPASSPARSTGCFKPRTAGHRRDALQAAPAGRPPTLRPPQGHRRAGLRPDSRRRAASPPSACAGSLAPPASTCWPASPTTSASCCASARFRPPAGTSRGLILGPATHGLLIVIAERHQATETARYLTPLHHPAVDRRTFRRPPSLATSGPTRDPHS